MRTTESPRNLRRLVGAALLPAALAGGCASMSTTEKGLLGGAGLGAVTGAVVADATGNKAGTGAVIGGALGAIAGGLTGNAIEESEKRTDARIAAANAQPPLSVQDVVSLAQQHVGDDLIIGQIRSTGSSYNLTSNDIIYLRQSGVSSAVVREMQATAVRSPRRVYSEAPVYVQPRTVVQPVYVVEPPPPQPVGVGFSYTNVRRR